MLDMIDENIRFEDFSCRVTASIGISYYPRHGKTLNHLMLAADKAMYASKSNGKGKFLVAT